MIKKLTIICLILATALPLSAADILIKGRVASKGQGIANVLVTDGESFAKTDNKGKYKLEADTRNPFVYICVPKGYYAPSEQGVVKFYKNMPEGKRGVIDFNLEKRNTDETFQTIIATADPQVAMEKEFAKLRENAADIQKTADSYKASGRFVHGICAGDLTGNKYSTWFDRYNMIMDSTGLVFRNAMGNHDFVNFGRSHETSLGEWEKTYGPTYFSYDIGDVHYVFLNNNFYIGRQWYYIAYLDEKQLSWLEKDLSYVKPGTTVFAVFHIPATRAPEDRKSFSYDRVEGVLTNQAALFKLLEPFDAHIINGHTHTTFNQIVRDNLYVHTIPALCGAWWQGPICTDGTPIGYTVFEIDNGKVSNFYYKTIGKSKDFQLKIYTGKDAAQYEGYAVANVWAYDDSWSVEFILDGKKAGKAERFETVDHDAKHYYSTAENLDYKWIGVTPSDHYFRCPLPEGTKSIAVKVTDHFGKTYSVTYSMPPTAQ